MEEEGDDLREFVCNINSEADIRRQCIIVANRLVDELFLLDHPRYKDVSEIEINHLLTMYCKMMDMSLEDFLPSNIPWKPIDDIIMSLKDEFGAEKFEHLDSMLISMRDPLYLLFLLDIFDNIVRFKKQLGKRFDNFDNLKRTILTDSQMTTPSPAPTGDRRTKLPPHPTSTRIISPHLSSLGAPGPSLTDMELDLEILQNSTGNEEVNVKQIQETSKRHKLQVYIPKAPKTPAEHGNVLNRSPNNDAGVNSTDERATTMTEDLGSFEIPSGKKQQPRTMEIYRPETRFKTGRTQEAGSSQSQPPTDRQPQRVEVHPPGANAHPHGTTRVQATNNGKVIEKREIPVPRTNLEIPGTVRDPRRKNSSAKRTSKSESKRPQRNEIAIEDDLALFEAIPNVGERAGTSGSQQEGNAEDVEGSNELEGVYSQLQEDLVDEFLGLNDEVESVIEQDRVKKTCTTKTAGANKVKYDYFGRPIKERFPYYPYGIIRPRCHGVPSGKQPRRLPPPPSNNGNFQENEDCENN